MMSVEAGAGRTTHPWDNPETHESCSGVPRALCSYTTLQLPDEDVLLSKAFAPRVEVLEDGTEVPLELDLSVPPLAAPAGPRIEKQPPTRLVGGESFLSESDLNTLGQPQFYIDVSEMSGAAHTVSGNLASPASFAPTSKSNDQIQVNVQSFYQDRLSRDADRTTSSKPGEPSVESLLVRSIRFVLRLDRSLLAAIPALAPFSKAKAIQLELPRAAAASALVTILESASRSEEPTPLSILADSFGAPQSSTPASTPSNSVPPSGAPSPRLAALEPPRPANTAVMSEDDLDELQELYALSHLLGNQATFKSTSAILISSLSQRNIVPVSYLAALFGDAALLKACKGWVLANLIDTGRLSNVGADGLLWEVSEHGSLYFKDGILAFRRFRLSLDTFTRVDNTPPKVIVDMWTAFPKRVITDLYRQGSDITSRYVLIERATKNVLMVAVFDPVVSEYVISRNVTNPTRHGPDYVGGIKYNLTGTAFTVFDNGARVDWTPQLAPRRRELGIIAYSLNFWGLEPRAFHVFTPNNVDETQGTDLESRVNAGQFTDLKLMHNRPPKWNEERGTYTLDFRNNVRKASKKNFILDVDAKQPGGPSVAAEAMMMGKIEQNHFYIHFSDPLSAVVAFGIAVSSFHRKLMVK